MQFTIALYGSFKDSSGYTWKLPNGYDEKMFATIKGSHLFKTYDDGRKLEQDEIHGGYFIDVPNDRFIAFRFIDGDQDALGRSGVVITNWAVTQYSKVVGKNIKLLFDRLTMKQMPFGESIEIDFPSEFSFNSNGLSVIGSERIIWGEEAKSVFQLPSVKCARNTLIQFTMKENQKVASINFLSSAFEPAEKKETKSKVMPQEKSIRKDGHTNHSTDFLSKIIFGGIGLLIVCVVCCFLFFEKKPSEKDSYTTGTTSSEWKDTEKVTLDSGTERLQQTEENQKTPKSTPKDGSVKSKIMQVCILAPKVIWKTQDCIWTEKRKVLSSNDISNKMNHYFWGELKVNQSEIEISFNKRITLRKKSNEKEYDICSDDQSIGRFEMFNDGWKISFRLMKSQGKHELSGDYYLYHGDDKCGKLSIQDSSIRLQIMN